MNDYEMIMQIPFERRAKIQHEIISERVHKINKQIRELQKDKENNYERIGNLLYERKYLRERMEVLAERFIPDSRTSY
jgi:hypothetical protein|nr:MAG TPA: hypothetical protein [Caudoviricetes sp.]